MVWINQRASEEDCITTTNLYSALQAGAEPELAVVKKRLNANLPQPSCQAAEHGAQ